MIQWLHWSSALYRSGLCYHCFGGIHSFHLQGWSYKQYHSSEFQITGDAEICCLLKYLVCGDTFSFLQISLLCSKHINLKITLWCSWRWLEGVHKYTYEYFRNNNNRNKCWFMRINVCMNKTESNDTEGKEFEFTISYNTAHLMIMTKVRHQYILPSSVCMYYGRTMHCTHSTCDSIMASFTVQICKSVWILRSSLSIELCRNCWNVVRHTCLISKSIKMA